MILQKLGVENYVDFMELYYNEDEYFIEDTEELDTYLKSREVMMAIKDKEVVGFITYSIVTPTELDNKLFKSNKDLDLLLTELSSQKIGFIESVVVKKEYRDKAVDIKLMKKVESIISKSSDIMIKYNIDNEKHSRERELCSELEFIEHTTIENYFKESGLHCNKCGEICTCNMTVLVKSLKKV